MAPGIQSKGKGHASNGSSGSGEMSTALNAKLSRKRTKTGCLTCRKRRIKCGEERPTCKNCTKSKRICEGYSQRVIFKPPNSFDFRQVGNGAAHINFHPDAGLTHMPPLPQQFPYGPLDVSQNVPYQQVPLGPYPGGPPSEIQHAQFGQQPFQPPESFQAAHMQATPVGYPQQPGVQQQAPFSGYTAQHNPHMQQPYPVQTPSVNDASPAFVTQPTEQMANSYAHANGQFHFQQPHALPNDPNWQHSSPTAVSNAERVSPESIRSSNALPWDIKPTSDQQSPSWLGNSYVVKQEPNRQNSHHIPPSTADSTRQQSQDRPDLALDQMTPAYYDYQQQQIQDTVTPTSFLAQAAVEAQDDDYYDVESDELMEESSLLSSIDLDRQRTLHTILQINNITIQDLQTRRYDTFIYDGILTRYKAEEVASPLRNPATARVFAHFISVTGPSLSVYERHPRNTSVLFTEGQIPFSQQGLWTYTMPMAALHHQGLLHAMLALASLHIARLQGASLTPSMQHYAWSLKRIHSCVSDAKKRYKLTTIAATMLLGFYEIMTADHMKWNMHLTGSKQLFLETDFVTMARQFRRLKVDRMARRQAGKKNKGGESPQTKADDEILDQIFDVDERVVSDFAGKEVRYDDYGQIMPSQSKLPPRLDLSRFEILKDLYWWYLKQDAYQSIVSGNALLLDYSRWTNCPPRAPLGKADAVYGSFDHLILLLGRIADFASKDRHRKLKQMDINGGHWIPPPGFKMQQPPQQGPPPTPASATGAPPTRGSQSSQVHNQSGPPPMPQFYGMAPPPKEGIRMPSSYAPLNSMPTPDTPSPKDTGDLQAMRDTAMEEYGRIRSALHAFELSLGEGFQPLSSDYQPSMETPFGNALFYRSYDIGCLWAIYHMAVIIAIRSHPDMHPAAHAAAAILANETHHHAATIGQIAAGIVPGPADQPLNPTLGSALCESCMPSFFAAIQYHDPRQRHHTVTRISSIAQRTGWGSAELIAHGCETAWVKAAQAGRGPPYQRILRQNEAQTDDPRKNGSWEYVDPRAAPDERNEADRRFVTVRPNARLNWAIGIMGTEADETLQAVN